MGLSSFLTSSAVVALCLMITGNKAESHHELCLGKMVNFTEIEYIALGECVKEYAPAPTLAAGVTESSAEIKERIKKAKDHKCMEACFMSHKGMFDKGKFNMAKSKTFIDEFPKEAHDGLTKSLETCAKLVEGKTLTMDHNCADYAAFIKCVDDDENKICKREE